MLIRNAALAGPRLACAIVDKQAPDTEEAGGWDGIAKESWRLSVALKVHVSLSSIGLRHPIKTIRSTEAPDGFFKK